MNFLAWTLSLSILMVVLIKAVAFHQASVCRQRAWLKSTELITASLLYRAKKSDSGMDLGCRIYLSRQQRKVSWRRLPSLTQHQFQLTLYGKL